MRLCVLMSFQILLVAATNLKHHECLLNYKLSTKKKNQNYWDLPMENVYNEDMLKFEVTHVLACRKKI